MSGRPRRILIAGCGYVGTALGLRLAAAGDTVFALRRCPDGLPQALRPLAADLRDPASLAELPGDLDAVFYTAAAGERSEAAYRAAYAAGVDHLLAALGGAGEAPRFFYASSTSVYAQDDGSWVDEASPTEPSDFSGRWVLEGERRARAAGFAGSAVRFGGIYGPGRERLLGRLRRGELRMASGPPRYTNRIHRDDCAGVLHHLLELPEPASIVLAVDCEPADERCVYGWLAQRLGVPPPTQAPPQAGSRTARSNKRCRNARLLASGYRFRYPSFREGYAAQLGVAAV